MNKYKVKNCPCFVEGIAIKGNEQKTQTCNNHTIRELTYCADITDCVLKQIVELCNTTKQLCDKCEAWNCSDCSNFTNNLDERILQFLDIQEVE